MDDNQQIDSSQLTVNTGQSAQSQPLQDLQQITQSTQTSAPVSSVGPTKESEPIAIVAPEGTAEYIKPSESAPEIPKEVAEAGVEVVSEMPQLMPVHKEIGIKLAKESVPVQTQPTGAVQLPQTQHEAELLLKKNNNVNNSFTWLIAWLIRQFKMSQQEDKST